ncbi:MAG: hypothetical protein RLZZ110_1041 [Bacteroidota bacterium]|jgi:hypothetical protein
MLHKTIIATLLALLSGAPLLKAQTIDTTSVDTLISITDSLIHKWVKEIDKGIQVQEGVIYRMPEDSMMVFSRDTFRMVKRRRRITKATIEETKQYWGYNSQIIDEASMKTIPTTIGDQSNYLPELNNAKSIHWGIEQQWGFNLIRGKVRVFTGIRYDIHNYRFQNNLTRLTQDQPEFTAVEIGGPLIDPIPVEKSKLVVNYIGVPVSLGFQDKPGDNSKFSAKVGVHAGYRVRTHTKIKQTGGNVEKQFDDFNMNDFYLSPFVNVSYGDMGLYMRYPLTNLFKNGQGANTQAIQFGITLKMS